MSVLSFGRNEWIQYFGISTRLSSSTDGEVWFSRVDEKMNHNCNVRRLTTNNDLRRNNKWIIENLKEQLTVHSEAHLMLLAAHESGSSCSSSLRLTRSTAFLNGTFYAVKVFKMRVNNIIRGILKLTYNYHKFSLLKKLFEKVIKILNAKTKEYYKMNCQQWTCFEFWCCLLENIICQFLKAYIL